MQPDYGYFEEAKLDKIQDVRLLKRLRPFIRPYRLLLAGSIGLVLIITFLELALPYVTKIAIDRYIVPLRTSAAPGQKAGLAADDRTIRVDLTDPQQQALVKKYRELFKVDGQTATIAYEATARIAKPDLAILRRSDLTGLAVLSAAFLALVILDFILGFVQRMIMEYTGHMIMHDLRIVKSPQEVDLIKKAAGITERTFRRLLGFIAPGVWEFEIEAEICHEFLRNRSRGPAFQTIIASGVDSCILHYVKNNKKCREGDLVLMDFGAEYANYAGDVTRTVPVSGRFSKRQKAVYNAVLNVHKAAIQMLTPGQTLDEYTREVGKMMETELIGLGLLDAGEVKKQPEDQPLYKKYFPHGTSHHLGLDVHDYGDRYRKFESGMVLTCEPGIYIKDEAIGIRIENDILITKDGPVDLTETIPREVDEIEDLMNK